jgi:predicted Zn-dependent peptidase
MRSILVAIIFVLSLGWCEPVGWAAVPRVDPGVTRRLQLPNGLRVILQQDRRRPSVAALISYHVGYRDEPTGYQGLAHLVEHMAFRGSRHVPPLAAMSLLERAGATRASAGTGRDQTMYFAELPSQQLELWLWLESDRMGFLLEHLDAASLELERRIVGNELRQMRTPARLLELHSGAALYPIGHPYHTRIDEERDVAAMNIEHVRWFVQQHYRPDNARLVLVGDFELASAERLVRKYFEPVGRPPWSHRRPLAAPLRFVGSQAVSVEVPYAREQLAMVWRAPTLAARDALALELLADLLAHGRLSRLHQRLVEQRALATAVDIEIDHADLASWVTLRADLARGRRHRELERAIDDELARLREAPITVDDLRAVKEAALARRVFRHEQLLARAILLSETARATGALYDPNAEIVAIAAFDAAALQRVARRWLSPTRLTVRLSSSGRAPRAGRRVAVEGALYRSP